MRWVILFLLILAGCGHGRVTYVDQQPAVAPAPPPGPNPHRRRAGRALRGLGKAFTDAGTPTPGQMRCRDDYLGGMVCEPY